MPHAAVLSLKQVHKSFKNRAVLSGLDLSIEEGECLALLGPNGAGKSTTIQIALGLSRASSGEVQVLGRTMPDHAHEARYEIGVVPQYDALDPDFTVLENLLVFGGYFGLGGPALLKKARELVAFASLSSRSDDGVSGLSGGMKRRLSLARALINGPKLLFLDEPTTALDPQAKHLIWERLTQLKRDGISIFLTTHFMDEAQRLADRVAVLDHGQIIAMGTPKELIQRFVSDSILEVWGAGAPAWIEKKCGVDQLGVDGKPSAGRIKAERRGETFYLDGQSGALLLAELNQSRPVGVDYLYRPGNLEDVFFRLTGRDLRDD